MKRSTVLVLTGVMTTFLGACGGSPTKPPAPVTNPAAASVIENAPTGDAAPAPEDAKDVHAAAAIGQSMGDAPVDTDGDDASAGDEAPASEEVPSA